MTAVNDGVDYRVPPADYAALYTMYYPIIVGLVKQRGVPLEHVDDVAAEIMLRLIERDVLAEFDPNLSYFYGGDARPARFRSFISKKVMLYAQGQRDKILRRTSREIQVWDDTNPDGGSWLEEVLFEEGVDQSVLDTMDFEELISGIRAYLATVPPRSDYDTLDLVAFFDLFIAQDCESGRFNAQELRAEIGVSPTAFYQWRRWLAHHVAAYLGEVTARESQ